MRKLYELCGSPTKTWKALPEGDHNSSVLEDGVFRRDPDVYGGVEWAWQFAFGGEGQVGTRVEGEGRGVAGRVREEVAE